MRSEEFHINHSLVASSLRWFLSSSADSRLLIGVVGMASSGHLQAAALLFAVLLCFGASEADQDTGSVIPAESRPCVDCHAFEFMQRALQDLKKTAFNLDARTETLVLRAERRALCDCLPVSSLG